MEINRAVSGALTSAKATTGLSLYEQATGQKLAVAGSTKAKRVIENPDGKLDGNDFLKLFLESLKHQDPTSPVETKDMMAQTAQLTTVETNVANKKALDSITKTLQASSQYQSQFGLLPSIGKLASLKEPVLKYDGAKSKDFNLYFEDVPKSGSIIITDSKDKKVREISLLKYVNETNQIGEDENGKKIEDSKGILKFIWDGRRDNGFKVAKGNYTIRAEYVGNDSKKHTVFLGSNIVESVQFKKSEPQLKMGDKYVAFSKIGEIR